MRLFEYMSHTPLVSSSSCYDQRGPAEEPTTLNRGRNNLHYAQNEDKKTQEYRCKRNIQGAQGVVNIRKMYKEHGQLKWKHLVNLVFLDFYNKLLCMGYGICNKTFHWTIKVGKWCVTSCMYPLYIFLQLCALGCCSGLLYSLFKKYSTTQELNFFWI